MVETGTRVSVSLLRRWFRLFFLFRFGFINNSTVGRRPNPALATILGSSQGNDKPMTYLLLYWQLVHYILTNTSFHLFLTAVFS